MLDRSFGGDWGVAPRRVENSSPVQTGAELGNSTRTLVSMVERQAGSTRTSPRMLSSMKASTGVTPSRSVSSAIISRAAISEASS